MFDAVMCLNAPKETNCLVAIRVIGLIRGPRLAETTVTSCDLTVEYGREWFAHEWRELHEWGATRF